MYTPVQHTIYPVVCLLSILPPKSRPVPCCFSGIKRFFCLTFSGKCMRRWTRQERRHQPWKCGGKSRRWLGERNWDRLTSRSSSINCYLRNKLLPLARIRQLVESRGPMNGIWSEYRYHSPHGGCFISDMVLMHNVKICCWLAQCRKFIFYFIFHFVAISLTYFPIA